MLMCFQRGRNNLVYAETKMNKSSSRSHAVFQIKISKRSRATSRAMVGGGGKVEMKATFGKLTVVDLAGSERIKKSGASGAQFKEATNINGSLLAFGNVVQALAEKKKFIPYRDSKLTRILEDSVGGNCKTSLLVCCSPSVESSDETVCTLDFASRAARIEITATINETTVMVDAKSLIADAAGEGLDTALKEKHREMSELENKLRAASSQNEAALKKEKEEAIKKQKAEMAKAVEAGKLVDTYKLKSEEAAKKIKELEAAVKEAAEAKEVRLEMKKIVDEKEREVQLLKATLAEERKARAQADDERAKTLVRQVSETKALLDEANARSSALEARAGEAETLVAQLGEQLQESTAALEAASAEASAAAVRAAEEHAAGVAKMAEEHAAALVEKEFEAMARIEDAVEAAKLEAEAEAEKKEAELVRQWSLKLSDQAEAAAAELAELAAELAETKESFDAERRENEELVETLKSETQASLTRISTLQREAEQLTSEIEAARAEVVEQREVAAAEAARLDAAHAEALANLNERRREDAAAAEKRLAEADEAHAADAEAIRARAESREKRLSWAFSASKALLAETNAAILADHARMKQRFDARDSRDDDVEKIAELSAEVNALDNLNMHLRRETQAIARELDNRDQNDYIFGNAPGHRSAAGPRKSLGSRTQSVSTGRTIDASSFLTAKGTSVGTRRTVRGQ
jgi:kinesin family protein 5